jgi:uncharacterized membrane protein YkoI
MINHHFKTYLVAALFLAASCVAACAADESVAVKMADLPPAVKKAIHEQAGKATVDSIEKVTDGGEITYEVEIGRGGRARGFTLDENGGLLDSEISLADTPPAVREAIKKVAGTGTVDDITKVIEDGEVSYDADITRDGKERTLTVDEKGKLTELQVFPAELPAPVQKTMAKVSVGGQLGDISKEFDEDGITYEVEINPDTNARTVTIDEKGVIVSDEEDIDLSKTPDVVQKAIKDALKDGELGSITKTTDEYGVNYDVDMKRGDKWDSLIIGSDGKVVQ